MVTRARNEIVQEHSYYMVLIFIRTILRKSDLRKSIRELEKRNENKDAN